MKRLQDKVAVVTGAASQAAGTGNGSAVALTFAMEGAKVVLVNRTVEAVTLLKEEIEAKNGDCMICVADVTKEDDVKKMVDTVMEQYGKIDILYNNVGGNIGHSSIVEMSLEEWYKGIDFNLTGTMLCCKYVIPHMLANGGSIINASSIAAIRGICDKHTSLLTYSVAKAGLHGLMKSLSAEYAVYRIRVNNIIIGMVETPLITNRQGVEVLEKRRKSIPLQIAGTAFDTAWAAVYLASDESRWVTGTEMVIDGGQTQTIHRPR